MRLIRSADKAPNVNFIALLDRYKNLLSRKLPAIRNITVATHLTFISVKHVQKTLSGKML